MGFGRWESEKASAIIVDASGFSGSLSATDTDVQTALATIDSISTGGSASVDTTNFDGILSASEDTIQKALDAIDDMSSVKANLVVTGGGLDVGVDDTTKGFIWLYGDSANQGGGMRFHTGASQDGTVEYFDMGIEAATDDFYIWTDASPSYWLRLVTGGAFEIYHNATAKVLYTTATGIAITDGTATAATIGFTDDDLYIDNNDADGEVYITAEKTGTGQSTLFHGDPDGAAELYYAGVKKLETTATGLTMAGTALTFNDETCELIVGDSLTIKTPTETLATFIEDAECRLYHNNVQAFATTSVGVSIYNGTSLSFNIGYTGDNVWLENTIDGGTFELRGEVATNTDKTLALFDPAGAAALYYAGTSMARTLSYGLQVGAASSAGTLELTYTSGVGAQVGMSSDTLLVKALAGNVNVVSNNNITGAVYTSTASTFYYANGARLSTTSEGISITDGTATAATIGFSADDLIIANNDPDGVVKLQAEKSGTGQSVLFSGDPDGAAELYYAGTKQAYGAAAGFTIDYATSSPVTLVVGNNSDLSGRVSLYPAGNTGGDILFYLGNNYDDNIAYFQMGVGETSDDFVLQTSNGQVMMKFVATVADMGAEVYHAGTSMARTLSYGLQVGAASSAGTLELTYTSGVGAQIGMSSDTLLVKALAGNINVISNNNITGAVYTSTASTFYYANGARLSTTSAGISITDGSATAATIGFSDDDLIIANNDPDGVVKLQAEKSGTGQSVLFSGDPDGAAELYYAGIMAAKTWSNGLILYNAAGQTYYTHLYLTGTDGGDTKLHSYHNGGNIILLSRNSSSSDKQLFVGDPEGAVQLYYAGTKVFETGDTGGCLFARQALFPQTSITSSSNSVAWNLATAQAAVHTLTENTTIAAPSNQVAGATYSLKIIQAAGVYTLAWNAAFVWGTASAPAEPAANGDVIVCTFYSDGTNMYGVEMVREEA